MEEVESESAGPVSHSKKFVGQSLKSKDEFVYGYCNRGLRLELNSTETKSSRVYEG